MSTHLASFAYSGGTMKKSGLVVVVLESFFTEHVCHLVLFSEDVRRHGISIVIKRAKPGLQSHNESLSESSNLGKNRINMSFSAGEANYPVTPIMVPLKPDGPEAMRDDHMPRTMVVVILPLVSHQILCQLLIESIVLSILWLEVFLAMRPILLRWREVGSLLWNMSDIPKGVQAQKFRDS
ncbi:hypothetical protein KY285_022919 [Solanum tuberosum]|nr:hypothetical protein KY285_022919 [Solanum tuberosum]